jgi:hypothetical protein
LTSLANRVYICEKYQIIFTESKPASRLPIPKPGFLYRYAIASFEGRGILD